MVTCCHFAALNSIDRREVLRAHLSETAARPGMSNAIPEVLLITLLFQIFKLETPLILDNYATHKHAKVKEWLKKHPRDHLHFNPSSASGLNLRGTLFCEDH